jgi:hypothetical protein
MGNEDAILSVSNMLALVYDAIAVAQKGLLANPTKDEERALNRTLAKLELERADLSAMLDALEDADNKDFTGPTAEQVTLIGTLTAEVDNLTSANLTASAAVDLTSRVLDLATKVADAK